MTLKDLKISKNKLIQDKDDELKEVLDLGLILIDPRIN